VGLAWLPGSVHGSGVVTRPRHSGASLSYLLDSSNFGLTCLADSSNVGLA
jgi:hypothetical protein